MKLISRSFSLSRASLFVCLLLHFSSALPQAGLSAEPRTPPHAHGAAPKSAAPLNRTIAPKAISVPLFFEANKGQTDSKVKFLTRSNGYTLLLTPTETVLAEAKTQFKGSSNGFGALPDLKSTAQAVVRMELVGANSTPKMNGLEELPGKVNYLIGNDPAQWHTGVPLYSEVRSAEVYPGVDLLFHGDQQQLEYDFIVAPGADPSKIAFRIRGAARMEIDAQGDLVLHAADSEFRMHRPIIYQTIASTRRAVEGGFVRKGKRDVAFQVGAYDRSEPLVIDPKIGFASFLGGNGDEVTGGFVVDNTTPNSPKLYMSGFTSDSTTFPEANTVIGSGTSTTPVVAEVGFVAKIDPSAASAGSLIYLTFIGGMTPFQAADKGCESAIIWMSLDETQAASGVQPVLGGETNCSDYPNTIVINPDTAPSGNDFASVVTRLTPTGNAVDKSALLGGNLQVSGSFVSVGNGGEVVIAGSTSATNLPVQNAYVSTINNGGAGFGDCFVAKLERSDLKPTYLTYTNTGEGSTDLNASGCGAFEDSSGNILAGGNTVSASAFNLAGVNLANGFEPNFPASATEVTWAAKLNPSLSGVSQLVFATYFGGGGSTRAANGSFDLGNGVVAIVGATTSETTGANAPDIPLKNAYQNTNLAAGSTGGQTGYLLVIDTSQIGAASLLCSTYFGGSGGADVVSAVSYDAGDPTNFRIILGGRTRSTDFPTVNPIQSYVGASGSPDGFVSVLGVPLSGQTSPASLVFSTYIGGANPPASINGTIFEDDRITGVGVDENHTVYAVGLTNSAQGFFASTNPATTVNGFQTTCTSCSSLAPIDDSVVFSIATGGSATLQSIAVTPTTATIADGQTQQFHAVGNYSDGTEQDITSSSSITWSTSPTGIATMSTTTPGLATGTAAGTTAVTPVLSPTSSSITILNTGVLTVTGAGAATHFTVSAPAAATAGMAFNVTVTALDASNNVATGYTGTVHFTSTDVAAVLPINSTLTAGIGTFAATLNTAGSQTIAATDTVTASITGTSSAITVSAVVTGGQGVAQVSPTSLSFGNQPVGTTSGTTPTVTLANVGTGPLGSISISSNNSDYAITSNNCPASLAVGPPGCTFTVTFTPSIQALDTGAIVITDDATVSTTLVPLSGTGVGSISLTPFEMLFGSAEAPIPQGTPNGPQSAVLSNQSGGAITVSGISFVGNAAGDFSRANSTCPPSTSTLANGATCAIPVTFTPHGTGPRTADVNVASGAAFTQPPSSLTNLAGLTSIVSSSGSTLPTTAYDNFTLGSTSSVTGIQWMGFQSLAGQTCPNPPCIPAPISQFQISFYSNASNLPGTSLATYTFTGNANQTQIGTGTYSTETNLPVYSYSVNLSTPFVAQGGTTYWVSIVPTQQFPPFWAWLLGTGGDGTSAQNFNGSTTSEPFDLAFSLATDQAGQTYTSHLIGNGTILQLAGFTTNQLAPNDDNSTGAVTLPFSINFFGTTYSQLFVNNNGNVTFGPSGGSFNTFTPTGLTGNNGGIPIIAAYWADVDTSGVGSGVMTYGTDTVNGHQAFGVDWQDVGYFSSHTDKLNSFQLVLLDRSDIGAGDFDIEFNYDKIQWEAGDASGGSGGLCGNLAGCTPAAVGYSNGSGTPGTNFQLPGSFISGALLDGNKSSGLIYNSLPAPGTTAVPGRYLFQVRNGAVEDADLSLTMGQSANPVAPGQQEVYTLTVTSAGPLDATGVVVSDTLPANATLVSATFSGGSCAGTTTLTCSLGTIAADSTGVVVTVTITVNANATGTVANSASVTSGIPDSNPANNAASATADVSTTPVLTSVNPATGQQGAQNLSVVIAGLNTHFVQGTTVLTFSGTGITVASLTVSSATSATAVLNISASASTGASTVTMTTGAEVATLTNGFTVVAVGAAALTSVNPNAGLLGAQNVSVVITGQNTHFVQGTTVASFGAGITVVSLTVSSATAATAVLNISATAALGARNVSMTTGVEVATLAGGFSVAPFVVTFATPPPATPTNVPPGGSLAVGLILTGGPNFSGTVTLTCSDPTDPSVTCSIQPGSVTLTGNGTTQVAIVVNTFCTANIPALGPNPGGTGGGGLGMLLLAMLLGCGVCMNRRRPRWATSFAMLMLVVFAGAACSSLPKSPSGAATQPGLKNIVVQASAGGNVQNIPIQFNVE